jgi:hypothetical protein
LHFQAAEVEHFDDTVGEEPVGLDELTANFGILLKIAV